MVHYHSLTLTSHELTVAFLPLCFRNQPQQDSLQTWTALSLWHTRKAYSSLWSHATLISAPLISPFTVNFRTLNKYFPLTVIQLLLLTIASKLFSTKYSRLNHLFIPALKWFFSFAFHTQANMVYKYAHNFTNYFQKLTHIFLFLLSFVLYRLSGFHKPCNFRYFKQTWYWQKKVTKSKHHRLVTNIEKGYPFFKKRVRLFYRKKS